MRPQRSQDGHDASPHFGAVQTARDPRPPRFGGDLRKCVTAIYCGSSGRRFKSCQPDRTKPALTSIGAGFLLPRYAGTGGSGGAGSEGGTGGSVIGGTGTTGNPGSPGIVGVGGAAGVLVGANGINGLM
jgi:hypothetical protein